MKVIPLGLTLSSCLLAAVASKQAAGQTDQALSVGLFGVGSFGDKAYRELGIEGQLRWTWGIGSLGVGVRSVALYGGRTPNPGVQPYEGVGWHDDYELELSLEPRFVALTFSDRFGLFVMTRLAISRVTKHLEEQSPLSVSLDGTVTKVGAHTGLGLLLRVNSRLNLDVGFSGGFTWWSEPDLIVQQDQVAASWWWNASDDFEVGTA